MSEIRGNCHCGTVQIVVPAMPSEVLQCNCSLCTKTGWTGGYWHPDQVKIEAEEGTLNSYVQGDKTITLWNCSRWRFAYPLDTA